MLKEVIYLNWRQETKKNERSSEETKKKKELRHLRWVRCFFFFFKSLAWAVRPALCFLFLSCNLFLYFLYSNSLWAEINYPTKYSKKMEPCEPLKLATVLRTVRFDRGSSSFMHFSYRMVLRVKRTAKISGLRFFLSDRTVQFGFQNHDIGFNSRLHQKPINVLIWW